MKKWKMKNGRSHRQEKKKRKESRCQTIQNDIIHLQQWAIVKVRSKKETNIEHKLGSICIRKEMKSTKVFLSYRKEIKITSKKYKYTIFHLNDIHHWYWSKCLVPLLVLLTTYTNTSSLVTRLTVLTRFFNSSAYA